MADQGIQVFIEEYKALKGFEQRKDNLIEQLLEQYGQLNKAFQQEQLDHTREKEYNREIQRREQDLQRELRGYKDDKERDAFILVLIDGDGMIFNDELIKKGEIGGKEAASALWDAVRDYVQAELPTLPLDYKIMTRIYANLKGLGDACHKAGILHHPSTIEEFARGLTGSKHLFDFVDVGMGKDRADDKISEIFKVYINNCHCRHIMFGCSHDNGYARLLEEVGDRKNLHRITLVEGVPFERELAALRTKYRTKKFEGLFRTSKINIYQQYVQPPTTHVGLSTTGYQSPYQPTQPPYHPPQSAYQTPQSYYQPPAAAQTTYVQSQPTPQQAPQRPASTNINGSTKMNPQATSFASAAMSAPAHPASPPPTPQASPAATSINRNKFGQRVDQSFTYDKDANKKMRALHLCNVHFLRNDCPYGDGCSHEHNYKLSKNELTTLKAIARQTPCKFGSSCDDPICIYGHRCPVSNEDESSCLFGNRCWFPEDLHGIDTKVVQTTKIGK